MKEIKHYKESDFFLIEIFLSQEAATIMNFVGSILF